MSETKLCLVAYIYWQELETSLQFDTSLDLWVINFLGIENSFKENLGLPLLLPVLYASTIQYLFFILLLFMLILMLQSFSSEFLLKRWLIQSPFFKRLHYFPYALFKFLFISLLLARKKAWRKKINKIFEGIGQQEDDHCGS